LVITLQAFLVALCDQRGHQKGNSHGKTNSVNCVIYQLTATLAEKS